MQAVLFHMWVTAFLNSNTVESSCWDKTPVSAVAQIYFLIPLVYPSRGITQVEKIVTFEYLLPFGPVPSPFLIVAWLLHCNSGEYYFKEGIKNHPSQRIRSSVLPFMGGRLGSPTCFPK